MALQDERDRLTRLEEQMRNSFYRHRGTEEIVAQVASEVKDLSAISIRHSETMGVLVKCVYGTVAVVLLSVGGAVLSLVLRTPYRPVSYVPAATAAIVTPVVEKKFRGTK